MGELIPARVLNRIGDSSAQPRVTRVYRPAVGWSADDKKTLLTQSAINALRGDGVTRVDAKWKSRRYTLALFDLALPSDLDLEN